MADLTVQTSSLTGLNLSTVAAAGGGDTFTNDGATLLYVNNGGGSPITVTVDSQVSCNQGSDHDSVTSVTNAQSRYIGPFPRTRFNNSNGKCAVTYSGVTTVTVAAVKLANVPG